MATARPRARANGSARSNGHNGHVDATPPAPAGPQIEARYEWVAVDETAYPGFKMRLWTNHPFELWRNIYRGSASADVALSVGALTRIVSEHNGWRDYDGTPYPPANTPAFWDALPVELFRVILYVIDEGPNLLPNSLRATRLASASSSIRTSSAVARPG